MDHPVEKMRCAADCHAHIIDPAKFPFTDGPGYRPGPDELGDVEQFRQLRDAHGLSHALLVQPSCYGDDNACLLDAIARSGGRDRGIAVASPGASEEHLLALKRHGVVGLRLHLVRSSPDGLSRPEAEAFLARVKALDWFLEVFAVGEMWRGIVDPLVRSGVKLLIAHLGEPDVQQGIGQPGFQAVLRLGREAGAVMKLSAPFRVSAGRFPYPGLEPYVSAVVEAFGLDRLVWGSDWPFLDVRRRPDYEGLLQAVGRWFPSADDRERLLWRNPARLFGFSPATSAGAPGA